LSNTNTQHQTINLDIWRWDLTTLFKTWMTRITANLSPPTKISGIIVWQLYLLELMSYKAPELQKTNKSPDFGSISMKFYNNLATIARKNILKPKSIDLCFSI
jgi:hypothetical protein